MSTAHIARALSAMDEPFVRYKIRLNVSDRPPSEREIRILRDEIRESVLVRTLLAELDATGRIPLPPSHRWRGAHWVLYMLADLGSAPRDKSLWALRDQACEWLLEPDRPEPICGAIEGNALYYLLFLEIDDGCADTLAQRLAGSLPKALGRSPAAFGQALTALRGLALHARLRADRVSADAAARLAEHLLAHRLYQKPDGSPLSADCASLHYPCYEHCDFLFGLKVMAEVGARSAGRPYSPTRVAALRSTCSSRSNSPTARSQPSANTTESGAWARATTRSSIGAAPTAAGPISTSPATRSACSTLRASGFERRRKMLILCNTARPFTGLLPCALCCCSSPSLLRAATRPRSGPIPWATLPRAPTTSSA